MFQTKVVEKIKTHILCSVTFSQKSCRLWDMVEKYCRAGQAIDGNMAHALRITWIPKATHTHTHTHSEHVIRLLFHVQQWLHDGTSMLSLYACTLPVSFIFPSIYVWVFQVIYFLRFVGENPVCIYNVLHPCHMPRPSQSPWFHCPNNILRSVRSHEAPQYDVFSILLLLSPS